MVVCACDWELDGFANWTTRLTEGNSVGPGLHAPDLHQAGNAILTHTDTLPFEGSIHFRAAVAAFTLIEYPPEYKQQFCILRGPLPWLAIYPGVVPGARDSGDGTRPLRRVVVGVARRTGTLLSFLGLKTLKLF